MLRPHLPNNNFEIDIIWLFNSYTDVQDLPYSEKRLNELVTYSVSMLGEEPFQALRILKDLKPFPILQDPHYFPNLADTLSFALFPFEGTRHAIDLFKFYGPIESTVDFVVSFLGLIPDTCTEILQHYGPNKFTVERLGEEVVNKYGAMYQRISGTAIPSKTTKAYADPAASILQSYGTRALEFLNQLPNAKTDMRLVEIIRNIESQS